jgi:hypothetical protein
MKIWKKEAEKGEGWKGEDKSCNLQKNVLGYFYRGKKTLEKREFLEVFCRHGRIGRCQQPVFLFFGKRLLKK